MRNTFGNIFVGVGFLGSAAVWLLTTLHFFSTGQTLLGLIALVIPPADLVLPFLVSPIWGFAGLGAVAVLFTGFALKTD